MSFTIKKVREDKEPPRWRKYLFVGLPLLQSALQFYKHFAHAKHEEEVQQKREHMLKRTVTVLLAGLLVLLLLIGTLKVLVRLKTIALGMASVVGTELPKDENGFTNILLLGEGDANHDGVDLTDTIMVASLDPSRTKSAVLLSIPRDTYVLQSEKMGKGRMNSLYRDYKISLIRKEMSEQEASAVSLQQLAKEVGELIGLELHGVLKVNFSGFEQTIDAIGGIDIDVPYDILDTEYPGPNYSYETFAINKGVQHLDGATALKYARTRHSTSDFSRSGRQQAIIAAAGKKMKDDGLVKNVGRLTEILSILAKNVETTFSTRELLGLASMGKSIDTQRIVSIQLNDQNGLYGSIIEQGGFLYSPPREEFDGAAVLLPVSVPEFPVTWKQIQKFSSLIFQKREAFFTPPRIAVLNGGGKEGLARKLGGELYRYGFNIVKTRNYGPKGSPTFNDSFIAINPRLKEENDASTTTMKQATWNAELLSSILKLRIEATPENQPFMEDAPDIIIVLGKNFELRMLQDLL